MDIVLRNDGLTYPTLFIEHTSRQFFEKISVANGSTIPLHREPGAYKIYVRDPEKAAGKTLPGDLWFTVDSTGQVVVPPACTGALRAEGTTLHLVGCPIQIEIPRTSLTFLSFRDLESLGLAPIQTLQLLPGLYTLAAAKDGPDHLDFQVTPAGTVTYAAELQGVLEGSGSRLVLRGADISVDATPLTPTVTICPHPNNLPNFESDKAASLTLLPGDYYLLAYNAYLYNWQGISQFRVTAKGEIEIDSSQDPGLKRIGPRSLLVSGCQVKIDATKLSYPRFQFDQLRNKAQWDVLFETKSVQTLVLLPGQYDMRVGLRDGERLVGLRSVYVTRVGLFDFRSEYEGQLAGKGTDTLTVSGYRIRIDPRGLTHSAIRLRSVHKEPVQKMEALEFNLLGSNDAHCLYIDNQNSDPLLFTVDWAIGVLNAVGTSPWTRPVTEGWGTQTLICRGATVRLDLRLLKDFMATYWVERSESSRLSGDFFTKDIKELQLLPGTYQIRLGTVSGGTPRPVKSPILSVEISGSGVLTTDPSDPHVLSVRANNTVQVGDRIDGTDSEWRFSQGLPAGCYTAILTVEDEEGWSSEPARLPLDVKA